MFTNNEAITALDEQILEVITGRAMNVLASTPLDEGEYIAHGLWGHELATRLSDSRKRETIHLIDIRSRDAYDEGHIEGAHHLEISEWATAESLAQLPLDKKIIVISDTGLSAAGIVAGLRLLGYDAAVPRTGINGWTQTPMSEDLAEDLQSVRYPVKRVPPQEECAPAPRGVSFERPAKEEFDLIAERMREVSGAGNVVTAADLNSLMKDESEREEVFLLDLRREEDFEGVGHIEGSLRMDFDAAVVPENLERIPRDKKIVIVCYTGNLAAQLTTIYRLLGFDAAALAYGMAGWTRTPTTYLYLRDIQKARNPLV